MWYNQINKNFFKMIKFGNEEDVAAIDEGNLYLKLVIMKLVIMMKMQQLLIMQIQHNLILISTTTKMTIITIKRLYKKKSFMIQPRVQSKLIEGILNQFQ